MTPGRTVGPDVAQPQPPTTEEIDRACRWPVLGLLICSALWLMISARLGLATAIKTIAPGFFSNQAFLTYGRLYPAAANAFLYGFAVQAGLALALWLAARLGRARPAHPLAMLIATLFWNLGVTVGLIGILAGDSTGVLGLEMPSYACGLLLAAYAAQAWAVSCAWHHRAEAEVYVSMWYVLGAVLSFPCLYLVATLQAVVFPLRGVMQAVVEAWYAEGISTGWLTFLGLAVLFYFVPRLTNAPVPSRSLAAFGFWALAVFGTFGGLRRYAGGPFPAYLHSVATVAGVLTIVPVVAVVINLRWCLRDQTEKVRRQPVLWFMVFATAAYAVAGCLEAANSLPWFNRATRFTPWVTALDDLKLYGFFSLAMLGAAYDLTPRLLGCPWPSMWLVRGHWWCAVAGVLVKFLALAVAGLRHGQSFGDPAQPFPVMALDYLPWLRASAIGDVLWLLGVLAFLINLVWLLWRWSRVGWWPRLKSWFQPQHLPDAPGTATTDTPS